MCISWRYSIAVAFRSFSKHFTQPFSVAHSLPDLMTVNTSHYVWLKSVCEFGYILYYCSGGEQQQKLLVQCTLQISYFCIYLYRRMSYFNSKLGWSFFFKITYTNKHFDVLNYWMRYRGVLAAVSVWFKIWSQFLYIPCTIKLKFLLHLSRSSILCVVSLPRFSIRYFLCKTFNQVIPIEIVDSEPGKESSILSDYRSELFGLNVDVSWFQM